jgi:hypothetical protein
MNTPTCNIDVNGNKRWWLNGKVHREDGPAIEWKDGDKEWWLNGEEYITNKSFQIDANLSDDDMIVLNLKYGPI